MKQPDSLSPAIILIVRKKGGHGGHHGGAWKVAYADFVTAMMALFIVLWLMNTSSQEVKEAIAGYFTDPKGFSKLTGSGHAGSGESMAVSKGDMEKLGEKLAQAMGQLPEFGRLKENVQFIVTGEGLRVELLESEKGLFFDSGSAGPSVAGEEMLALLARELAKLPNELVIEGHTDSRPFAAQGYSNWELSADRANAARRLMQHSGLRANQVVEVRGFADQQLRRSDSPEDASNRRVSVIVRYPRDTTPPPPPAKESKPPAPAARP